MRKQNIFTIQDDNGYLAIMTIGEEGRVYVRYINPYVNEENCEVPKESVDALFASVEKKISCHNGSSAGKKDPWGLEMY